VSEKASRKENLSPSKVEKVLLPTITISPRRNKRPLPLSTKEVSEDT
jgi:hypothetical protein